METSGFIPPSDEGSEIASRYAITGYEPLSLFECGDELVNRVTPALAALCYLARSEMKSTDMKKTRAYLEELLSQFREELAHERDGEHICLWISAALDEQLNRVEGEQNLGRNSLCSKIFLRRDAGVYCFTLLENWMLHPEQNLSQLQVVYWCIKCGFMGRYRRIHQEQFLEQQVRLYQVLAEAGKLQKVELSPPAILVESAGISRFSLIKPIAVSALVIVIVFCTAVVWTRTSQGPVQEILSHGVEQLRNMGVSSDFPSQEAIRDAFYLKKKQS